MNLRQTLRLDWNMLHLHSVEPFFGEIKERKKRLHTDIYRSKKPGGAGEQPADSFSQRGLNAPPGHFLVLCHVWLVEELLIWASKLEQILWNFQILLRFIDLLIKLKKMIFLLLKSDFSLLGKVNLAAGSFWAECFCLVCGKALPISRTCCEE